VKGAAKGDKRDASQQADKRRGRHGAERSDDAQVHEEHAGEQHADRHDVKRVDDRIGEERGLQPLDEGKLLDAGEQFAHQPSVGTRSG